MNKPWHKKWWGILLIALLTIALMLLSAFGFLLIDITKQTQTQAGKSAFVAKTIPKEILGEDNYWIGSANPKITLVEFADFACPHCANTFPVMRELSIKYKKDIKIIFRDFPVITETSGDLALAARCAGEQGFFWVMHDKLFLNQGISTGDQLKELAKQTGVNMDKFNTCFDGKKYLSKIQKDLTDGNNLGVTGTPTWFINGQKVAGDIPLSGFEQIIKEILNN
ncbi:DsbA family protein [Candidatus Parcubacteria bacterium]|nr:DsbA family protein [Patescibacteria group bacterium]MBU4308907.1 DsbA family protein [Patescibacteria group bacterium]MBU4432591.1 DsbA family protein [Patescibacteria group bacterium]MBU4577267.1 DsbA family protein [Patescibacteria group bacterium]MCG2696957.1 DsbA family protein [Candidatus Parcubacteria bacterium]